MDTPNLLKEAFSKIKEDIQTLQSNILWVGQQIEEINRILTQLKETQQLQQTNQQTHPHINPTQNSQNQQINPNPTDKQALYASISPFTGVSTRNEGVPTDRQTNQQTDTLTQKTQNHSFISNEEKPINIIKNSQNMQISEKNDKITKIEQISQILDSFDSLKKEIRQNFKHLTNQEMAVFSLIYELENQGFIVDYPILAQKTGLSESSIRDYTQKIIKKGIPLLKFKENNKKIILRISSELKKIASLQTISALRNL
jgi:DNA polymerase I-like protein with 3'-5' exonuclease and polymerase domains